ncbi:unnamed protein product [Nippostrongylus brasiliensis]|uniref:Guanylate cyclase n=1 Tax=Nippostrongylus brasiliensis TaxID=27835 RepID=A0A158QXE8_NIPBR|nr:unnamed protein product [Nippostrongylus brasiliensis]
MGLTWVFGECIQSRDAGALINWIESGADVVLGPACSKSAIISGTVAKYYDFPLVIWATTFASTLLNNNNYPSVMSSTWSSVNQARTLNRLFQRYSWTEVAVVYYALRTDVIPRCSLIISDLEVLESSFEVTVICLESLEARRNLMVSVAEEGMDTNDYMWLMIETRRLGFGEVWKDTKAVPDGKDDLALRAAQKFFVARYTGTVIMNKNYSRDPVFLVYGVDSSGKQTVLMQITEKLDNDSISLIQDMQPAAVIWATHGGAPPRNRPLCDFDGSACPLSFTDQYLAIIIGAVVFPICLFILVTLYILRSRRLEQARLNGLWQIPTANLVKLNTKSGATSSRSLQSTTTTSTKLTLESKKDTLRHSYFMLDEDAVVARRHNGRPLLKGAECASMRKMRNVDHDNVCKFYGLSLDGPQIVSIWRYCSRGSLKDVIARGSLQMDWFFKYSLIRDISEGLFYIHQSFGAHGWLSSGTCLVDERWQVKICFYGLEAIKAIDKREHRDLLWTAPEMVRDLKLLPKKESDMYSFAIVCSEIITKKSAWDLENQDYDLDELVYKIKRGGRSPIRPSLETEDEHNASLSLLIKDCWSEEIGQRPSSDQVRSLIKSLNENKSANLMDHVFNVLEQYASNLEEEVLARTKELTEEKKRSDILLYRMLPRQVAEKLKLGQSVEPETFDCVTLFFSDVVSFTTLASRCTPLQVVTLLNDLYTVFDAIIDERDVYKVETIGDGYLCVSGLPHRNGNEHAKEIAEMSFKLLEAIRRFRVAHLPSEKINIRVGLHTGTVVTGVVGVTMPRYCLFGDAVNTASRMESNGKPGRIHISTDTMKFLTEVIGGYKTELRGEVIVKGKGAMETYWLLTKKEQEQAYMD